MFIKNDPEGRWVNGTLGTISECLDKKKKYIKVKINKKTHKVEVKLGTKLDLLTMRILMRF